MQTFLLPMTLYDPKAEIPELTSDLGLKRPDRARGWVDWLTTVDHKKIGIMYGLAALFFFSGRRLGGAINPSATGFPGFA